MITHVPTISERQARDIYDLLIDKAGATVDDADQFVAYMTSEDPQSHGYEWRFCGLLGFGGKLHYSSAQGAAVSCYREDRDEVRDALIAYLNERISPIAPGIDGRRSAE